MSARIVRPEPTIDEILAKRGFRMVGQGDEKLAIIPKGGDLTEDGEFHKFYNNYTFRKIMRHIVAKGGLAHTKELKSICSSSKLKDFMAFLINSRLVKDSSDDTWELEEKVDSWGYTLEWYISELMYQKLGCASQWGVKIGGLYAGGDYDVLSFVNGLLIYIESKGKNPDEICDSEIKYFLQRVQDLSPEIAIMLVDTDSQLAELVHHFTEILLPIVKLRSGSNDAEWIPAKSIIKTLPEFNELHFYPRQIFITNSQPQILHSIQDCLRYYYTHIRVSTYFSYVHADYLNSKLMD